MEDLQTLITYLARRYNNEDIVNECNLQILKSKNQDKGYLIKLIKRTAYKYYIEDRTIRIPLASYFKTKELIKYSELIDLPVEEHTNDLDIKFGVIEQKIIDLRLEGYSDQEISDILNIPRSTINLIRAKIQCKLSYHISAS